MEVLLMVVIALIFMTNAEKIKNFFAENGPRSKVWYERTEAGIYCPSSIEDVDAALRYLMDLRLIHTNLFCDAGSGDGRVPLLVTEGYDIPSIAVEHSVKWHEIALSNVRELGLENLIENKRLIFCKGDFTSDETYRSHGLDFRDISFFYNFFSNQNAIARKIALDSPSGTVFLYHAVQPVASVFAGLQLRNHFGVRERKIVGVEKKVPQTHYFEVHIK